MKTVVDAVNEKIMNAASKLEGELLNAVYANTHKSNYKKSDVFLHKVLTNRFDPTPVGGFVIYSSDESDRDDVEFICTTDEFLATVAECETNFGKCSDIAISHWKKCTKVLLDKELDVEKLIDINLDWSKDDEYIVCTKTNSKTQCWTIGDKYKIKQSLKGDFVVDDLGQTRYKGEFAGANFTLQAKSTPVFTKEMADDGVLPSVGMECELSEDFNGFRKGCVLKVYSHDVSSNDNCVLAGGIIEGVSGGVQAFEFHVKYLKPLTPPKTDDEKFMDALVEYNLCTDDLDWKEHLLGFIKSGKLHGVSFQPLTVEEK